MAAAIRFRPPSLEPPAELRWLLAAALAARWEPPPAADGGGRIAELAARFDLAPRIVARHGAEKLRRALGDAAKPLERAHRGAVAQALASDRLAAEIAGHASRLDTEVIFLKGYALRRVAPGPAGLRPQADLDLLVSPRGARGLRDSLTAAGFRQAPVAANEQHLPPLLAPSGISVDLHFQLRGVTLGERWATAGELLAAGLCTRLAELPGSAWSPSMRLLTAHLLVHGIDQHGFRPLDYPLLRMVADLIDVLPRDTAAAPAGVAQWIAAAVSRQELEAACGLAHCLAGGELPARDGSGARLLLDHIVAGTLDPRYARSLRRRHTAGRLRTALREKHLARYLFRKLRGHRA